MVCVQCCSVTLVCCWQDVHSKAGGGELSPKLQSSFPAQNAFGPHMTQAGHDSAVGKDFNYLSTEFDHLTAQCG